MNASIAAPMWLLLSDTLPVELSKRRKRKHSGFCSMIDDAGCIMLKEKHSYYAQIQGQMVLGQRPWCDFVIYTQTDKYRITGNLQNFEKFGPFSKINFRNIVT